MKKPQAVKFWKSLPMSTDVGEVIRGFANKKGYGGERTLKRFVQADRAFQAEKDNEAVSKLTGWSPKYLSKIRAWWDQMPPQGNHRRIGEPPAPVKAVEISPMRASVIGHTEKLLKVFEDFRNIEQFALHDTDLATWWSRPDEPSWPVPKGRAWREVRESLRVKFDAASAREWSYLQQHLVDDPVWGAIEHCHEALADDLAARLKLLDRIAALVQQPEERGGWACLWEQTRRIFRSRDQRSPHIAYSRCITRYSSGVWAWDSRRNAERSLSIMMLAIRRSSPLEAVRWCAPSIPRCGPGR